MREIPKAAAAWPPRQCGLFVGLFVGRTAYVGQGSDVLTGFMSGCLIARGTYNGAMSVFHMGTLESQAVTNLVKTGFRTDLPTNVTGFYPAAAWLVGERATTGRATDIVALVTSAGSS